MEAPAGVGRAAAGTASESPLAAANGNEEEPDWGSADPQQPPQDPGPQDPQDPQPPQPLPGPCANAQTGTDAKDKLTGTAFGDLLRGGKGNDTLRGAAEAGGPRRGPRA